MATAANTLTSGDPTLELSIIVPTFNERENVLPLLERLQAVLNGTVFEVVFVDDDSPDGTAELVRQVARTAPRVRVIQRIGRRGLASAGLEGMLSSSAPYMTIMDADLQHDESVLPVMFEKIRSGEYDLVVGSRNIQGGGMGAFARERVALSQLGRRISQLISRQELSDPMSGYFMLTRDFFDEVMRRTTGVGFKILLDLVASSPRPVRVAEVPYIFRTRQHGESKLDINVGVEYLYLISDKLVGAWLPIRFVVFCLVGLAGVAVHLGVLWLLYRRLGLSFSAALIAAIIVAMFGNFALNNMLTYRDRRRRGMRFITGLLLFCAACSVGSLSNYAVAKFLVASGIWWPLASLCGLAVASVWNFGATGIVTWGPPQRAARPGSAPLNSGRSAST
ncbi:MAG: glycosyltransferase family 2 protein [Bryobacteraceae bacterium]